MRSILLASSPVVGPIAMEPLAASLEQRGVRVILCKTCLDFHGLSDRVAVGVVGGMHDIIAAQWAADKVVTI